MIYALIHNHVADIDPSGTLKPVLRDHRCERQPVLKDQIFLKTPHFNETEPVTKNLSPKTCHQKPHALVKRLTF